jgi:hypothetical protein
MIWIRGILLAVSLIVAVIGAVTAYVPRTDMPDQRLIGLHLNAPALGADGRVVLSKPPEPKEGEEPQSLTAEQLQAARDAGIQRIRVKQFALDRWTGMWLFLVGSTGLVASAVLKRVTRRPTVTQGMPGAAPAELSPDAALDAIIGTVQELQRRLSTLDAPEERLRLILAQLDAVQRTTAPAFIAARPELVMRLGLAGYAQLMDSFAAAERAINRAWSAAADNHEPEARQSLDRAAPLLAEAKAKMRS